MTNPMRPHHLPSVIGSMALLIFGCGRARPTQPSPAQWVEVPCAFMEQRRDLFMLSWSSELRNEIEDVLILPLLKRRTSGNQNEFVLVDPIEYKALTKGLRDIFAPLTSESQYVFTAVVFAKGFCPIDLDPVWNPVYTHENREVTVEFMPKLDDEQYKAMLRIIEKELSGPSLKLGTVVLTRDIWPFATCLKNGEILTRSSIHTPTRGLEDLEISYWDGVENETKIKLEISPAGKETFRRVLGLNINAIPKQDEKATDKKSN